MARWTFTDLTNSQTFSFPVNPSEGGTPERAKSISYENTAGPDGRTLIYEGRSAPLKLSWSGTILEQAHLQALEEWFDKRHQIQLTDDIGRQFMIYITDFKAERVRSALYPWKHRYSMSATVLSA